ncbi:hypothetical protein [Candidatus Sulfurimonas baltica]|uniref:Uncharacterized protein n=1 Tax=Candidatus Sulfurimonas baltica TaxID=2740404 RepID=A0A7S7LTP8_9BACT|nr:hypothetical protein [Candidatus Sulfurimonas baltica]QOY51351.1 hypothetical protein HUE88_09490 [Candidatus Sulfurimonas baltica]
MFYAQLSHHSQMKRHSLNAPDHTLYGYSLLYGFCIFSLDFSLYLKNYDVDIALANSALQTPEKDVIINATKDTLKDFFNAIRDMNIAFFDILQDTHPELFANIVMDFNCYKINRANIKKAYNALYQANISSTSILSKLRAFKPYHLFTDDNKSHIGSTHYYNLSKF